MFRSPRGLALALSFSACVGAGTRDEDATHEPTRAPQSTAAAIVADAPTNAAPASAVAPAQPTIEVADSKLPARKRIVSSKAASGLPAFVAAMPESGLVWVGPLAGNGGRDVLVYIPAGAK